jgi:hypothetical protein
VGGSRIDRSRHAEPGRPAAQLHGDPHGTVMSGAGASTTPAPARPHHGRLRGGGCLCCRDTTTLHCITTRMSALGSPNTSTLQTWTSECALHRQLRVRPPRPNGCQGCGAPTHARQQPHCTAATRHTGDSRRILSSAASQQLPAPP